MVKTKRRRLRRRRQTKRRGGNRIDKLTAEEIVNTNPIKAKIVNPKSNFVLCTYWWGRGRLNRNTMRVKHGKYESACMSTILDDIRWELIEEEDEEYKKQNGRPMTKQEKRSRLLDSDFVKRINEVGETVLAKKKADGLIVKEPITMEAMIDEWVAMCEKIGCNYLVAEYPQLVQAGYQTAINAKPLFIKKALEVSEGRSVVYIDGDMTVNSYPALFDMRGVDFMARGWNMDPRASTEYKSSVCFDPYVFETSGGIFYFANTAVSHKLLKEWAVQSAKPINAGKADDRIVSLIFNIRRYIIPMSMIQLPIEYLWLSDIYNEFIDKKDIDRSKIFVEHPACLTAEEAAADQGASTNREPKFYGNLVDSTIDCVRNSGIFYEYVYFPTKELVSSFGPWLQYLKKSKNDRGQPLFIVVPYDEKYGNSKYNRVALKNNFNTKSFNVMKSTEAATLPQSTSVAEILANLNAGNDVNIGSYNGSVPNDIDFVAMNTSENDKTVYLKKVAIDTSKPMYFKSGNPVLMHLLLMCETIDDINTHFAESYIFLSRIRCMFYE